MAARTHGLAGVQCDGRDLGGERAGSTRSERCAGVRTEQINAVRVYCVALSDVVDERSNERNVLVFTRIARGRRIRRAGSGILLLALGGGRDARRRRLGGFRRGGNGRSSRIRGLAHVVLPAVALWLWYCEHVPELGGAAQNVRAALEGGAGRTLFGEHHDQWSRHGLVVIPRQAKQVIARRPVDDDVAPLLLRLGHERPPGPYCGSSFRFVVAQATRQGEKDQCGESARTSRGERSHGGRMIRTILRLHKAGLGLPDGASQAAQISALPR